MSAKPDSKPAETPSPIGEISQEPSALESFLDANQKKLVIVGVLAILILVGYVIYDGLREIKIREEAGIVSSAKTVTEYEKAIQEVDSPNPKGSALILKSQLLWRDQQQQEAIATLEEVIADYPEHPAIGSAYASLGSYQQQLGNLTEAKEAFKKSAEAESAASSYALLSLGDLARQAGEDDEAKAYYDRIITEYEDSHFQVKGLARQRIELIGVKSPTEKAPEPPTPQGQPQPGDFSPPVGLPDISPTPKPTEQPSPKPTETPGEETPGEDAPTETTPADENTPKEEATKEAPADEATEGGEPAPAPAGEPTGTDEPTGAEEATGSTGETPAGE